MMLSGTGRKEEIVLLGFESEQFGLINLFIMVMGFLLLSPLFLKQNFPGLKNADNALGFCL